MDRQDQQQRSRSEQTDLVALVAELAERAERRFYGKYRGIVEDNKDAQGLARLRVRVPSVFGDGVITGWAMPCAPYAGLKDEGFMAIPDKGSGVWVEFEGGDLEFPIWVGSFWTNPGGESEVPLANELKPGAKKDDPAKKPQENPTRKIIKTKAGHTVQFEDKAGEELIIIKEGKNAHTIAMNKDGLAIRAAADPEMKKIQELMMTKNDITIKDGVHEHEVRLDEQGITVKDKAGNVIVTKNSGVSITDRTGNTIVMGSDVFQISSKVAFKIEAAGQPITITGSTVEFEKG